MNSNLPELTISELANTLKTLIEENFSFVKIKGEISGFKKHSSGHLYFSLKDENALINAIMWKGTTSRLNFLPEDGVEVIASGKVTTYLGRSQYQIIIDTMEVAGIGSLMALLEKRKSEFAVEGLFDNNRKKPIPKLPFVIGIITSETGAVIKDIIHRLKDRYMPHVLLLPVAVQGELAAKQIAYGIRFFNDMITNTEFPKPDILIVARGGGSIEDLWCFNEEIVVRAIANSDIPIISAVGHETDFTLADFVADLRAPTPTAAAEMAVPIKRELLNTLKKIQDRLDISFKKNLGYVKTYLNTLNLPSLDRILAFPRQKLDVLSDKLPTILSTIFVIKQSSFQTISGRLTPVHLTNYVSHSRQKLNFNRKEYATAVHNKINTEIQKLNSLMRILEVTSYKSVLSRGFTVIKDSTGHYITQKPATIDPNTKLIIEFYDGDLQVKTST